MRRLGSSLREAPRIGGASRVRIVRFSIILLLTYASSRCGIKAMTDFKFLEGTLVPMLLLLPVLATRMRGSTDIRASSILPRQAKERVTQGERSRTRWLRPVRLFPTRHMVPSPCQMRVHLSCFAADFSLTIFIKYFGGSWLVNEVLCTPQDEPADSTMPRTTHLTGRLLL